MIARAAVLVVEDETSLRTTMCAALTLMGFMTHQADSVEEALKVLGADHVDAIVLDVRLPDPTGLQTVRPASLAVRPRDARTCTYTGTDFYRRAAVAVPKKRLVRMNGAHVFYKPQPYRVLINQLN